MLQVLLNHFCLSQLSHDMQIITVASIVLNSSFSCLLTIDQIKLVELHITKVVKCTRHLPEIVGSLKWTVVGCTRGPTVSEANLWPSIDASLSCSAGPFLSTIRYTTLPARWVACTGRKTNVVRRPPSFTFDLFEGIMSHISVHTVYFNAEIERKPHASVGKYIRV